jgi:predicted dehydrogenase
MILMNSASRRTFLKQTIWATAAAYAAQQGRVAVATEPQPPAAPPSERLSVAVVGVNGRGQSHVGGFLKNSQTVVTHICDVDERKGQAVCDMIDEMQDGPRPIFVSDMRRLLDESGVDIVSIATPNHWHALGAIWAVQAGKDVYVEKPVSHNVMEGRRIVQAAEKYGRIVQTGTQSRSNTGMRDAMQFIHEGGIGDVKVARGLCYKRRPSIGPAGNYDVPEGVDYNLWLGPAQMAPITRPRFHYDWHWQSPYGNGDLGNQGIHQMDLCRWALNEDRLCDRVFSYGGRLGYEDAGDTANTQIVVHDYGDRQLVFEVRGLETEDYRGTKVGIIIEGTQGYVIMTSYSAGIAFDLEGNEVKKFSGGSDESHYGNFVNAVRERDPSLLTAHIEQGHLSSALCHLGNISWELGQSVGLEEARALVSAIPGPEDMAATFERTMEHLVANELDLSKLQLTVGPQLALDVDREMFISSDAANAKLTRDYRAPFVVPAADQL